MARHLVHSFILTAVLSPFVNAGPCRPSSSSAASSAAVGTTTTEHSTLTGSTLSTETIITISETASSSSDDATSTAEDATSTEESTVTGSAVSTDTVVTVSESVTSNSDDATGTEQSTLTGSTLSRDTTITASETATLSSEGTTKTEESTVTGSAASSTDVTITVSESDATTTATTCTPAEPPVYTETEDFMMTTMFEDAVTTTTAAEPPATTTEAYECVDNLKEPSPSGAICGTKGYPQGLSDGGRDLMGRAADTLLDCYKLCQEQPNCETFYFTGDYCELYKGTFSSVYEEDVNLRTYETRCFCDTGIEPAPTCEDTNPIINGGWDDGKFSPWDYQSRASGRDIVDFKIKAGGQGDSAYRFQTGNFHFDKSMWIYQDVKACPGITFTCTFNWWWDKYYAIRQNDGSRLVPYVRIYQDEDDYALTSRYPTSEDDTMRWMQGSFRFTVPDSGETRIWYIASSPQGEWLNTSDDPCKPEWVHRPNALALDSMVCYRN